MITDTQDRLEQVRLDIIKHNICPDLAKMATNLVMGDGNPDADIFFIGEAPGKKEDETGKPFVGAAGRLLDELLTSIDHSRVDAYITNIVKYRPPANRDPLESEKQAFWPFLVREIGAVKPKVIVTLGRHSMGYFLPDAVIGEVHGQLFETDYGVLVPLYHPAAAIYNRALRQTLFDDFYKLTTIIETLEKE